MSPTMIAPASQIVGAPRVPFPFGLFSVVGLREGSPDRWENGVSWESVPCTPIGGRGADTCDDPDIETIGLPKVFESEGGEGHADPFVVYGEFKCSPVGWPPAAAQARATDTLIAREEARVEQAFWTGDLGNTPNLVDGANVLAGGSAVSSSDALSLLEDWLAANYGSLGVIHMTRGAAEALVADSLLESRGGRLYTMVGTPVVAGAGYPGSSPTGAFGSPGETWLYASPALFGYRSAPFTSSSVGGDLLDRGTNDLYAIAERTYLLGFDPCGTAAVLAHIGKAVDGGGGGGGGALNLIIGSIPSSPVTQGTDVTIEVQANQAPTSEVILFARLQGDPYTELGEMTQVTPTSFVFNQPALTLGTFDLYASADGVNSPTITLVVNP